MENKIQKQNFLKCIKERIWSFKVFRGEGEGEAVINFDISHIQLEYGEQREDANIEHMKTLFVMYNTHQKKDCFFFSPVECDQYDTLYQHYLYGQTIKFSNLHRDPPNIERLIEKDSINTNNEELALCNSDKILFLDLLEISLIQEVELMGNLQFKNVIIYISRLKFKEVLKNNVVLDQKIQKVVQKVQVLWKEYSNSDLSIILKNILHIISKEYKIANHNTHVDTNVSKGQLSLFWPLLDETDFSNPYIDVAQLKSKNKEVDLKPGHHIFIWPGALSLFCNSQKHAIYDGNNKVVTLNLNKDDEYIIETMPLQKFKQGEQFISLCEYGIKEDDAFFRRSYTYSNRQSDHPFKVLLRSNLLQVLKDPLKISKSKYEVDFLPQICKTGFLFDAKIRKLHAFIDKIVVAFNDTFFVSLGQ